MPTTDFKGRAKRLDDIDLPKLGAELGVGEDEIHAFLDVETRGTGFDSKGRPRILFERHKFYKYVPANKRAAAVNAGLANKQAGGYGKESEQYPKLMRAIEIDRRAALLSCSWGLGQVMGFNHKAAGWDDLEEFIEAMCDDEENHLRASVNFIKFNGLDVHLRNHNWKGFAAGYNGSGYAKNQYDVKLADSYKKWSRIKDTPYTPEAIVAPEVIVLPETKPEVIVVKDNPPAQPTMVPRGRKGFAVLGSILAAMAAAIWEWWSK